MSMGARMRRVIVSAAERCGWLNIADGALVKLYLRTSLPTATVQSSHAGDEHGGAEAVQPPPTTNVVALRVPQPPEMPVSVQRLDLICLIASLLAAHRAQGVGDWHATATAFRVHLWPLLVAIVVAWYVAARVFRVYDPRPHTLWEEVTRITQALAVVAAGLLALIFFGAVQSVSRMLLVVFVVAALVTVCGIRGVLLWVTRVTGVSPSSCRKYAVVGRADGLTTEIIAQFQAHPEWRLRLAGVVLEDDASSANPELVVLGHVRDLGRIIELYGLDDVVFAVPRQRLNSVELALRLCENLGVGVMVALDFVPYGAAGLRISDLDGLPLLAFTPTVGTDAALVAKRAFDLAVSVCFLFALAPVMLFIAAAIRVESPGPLIVTQRRVGQFGRLFERLSFRTSYEDAFGCPDASRLESAASEPNFQVEADPRITQVGRVLRRYALDTLPQLWNVLRGDMSIVGPRPLSVAEVVQCKSGQRRRLSVKPGVASNWLPSEARKLDVEQRMELELELRRMELELDLRYIDHWSFWEDFKIAVHALRNTPLLHKHRTRRTG